MLSQTGEIAMPKLGLTMTEGTIAEWLVAPGDSFAEGALIVLVETDKITNEVPAPSAGTMLEHLYAAGATAPVGAAIARVRFGLNGNVAPVAEPSVQAAPPAAPSRAVAPPQTSARSAPPAKTAAAGERILATPYARRLAKEAGINIRDVPAPDSSIRLHARDIERFTASRALAPARVQAITIGRRVMISETLALLEALPERSGNERYQLIDLVALAVMRACGRDIVIWRGFGPESAIGRARANAQASLAWIAREIHGEPLPDDAGDPPVILRDLSGGALFLVAEDLDDPREIILTFNAPEAARDAGGVHGQVMTLTATAARNSGSSAAPEILEKVCGYVENPLCLLATSS